MQKIRFELFILYILFGILLSCSNKKESNINIVIPSLIKSTQVFAPVKTFQIALGDLDGDSDLDAVFSNMLDNHSQIMLNDGRGHFTDSGQKLTQRGHGVDLGDLDSDGDLDIFMTCAGSEHRSRIYFNYGKANFVDTEQDLGDFELSGNAVDLIDIDGDGDLDASIVYYQSPDKIYLNDGKGLFTGSGKIAPEYSTWGDLDSDGDVDIFVRIAGMGYKTMLNDGSGKFTDLWFIQDTTVIRGFTGIGDIDGDHDLDVIVTNGNRNESYPTKIFTNDGTGQFIESGQKLSAVKAGRVGLGDLNGDKSLDLVLTSFQQPKEVWLNDGSGSFRDSGIRLENNGAFHGALLKDLDKDGDLDIFVANYSEGSNEIWFNVRK